jgi:hypothetical protein
MMLILSTSCGTSQTLEFFGEIVMVDYPKQVDILKGNTIVLDDVYTGDMYAYDGLLVFVSPKHPDGIMYLFDAETGKRINAIGRRGQGADEFLNLQFTGGFEKDSNDTYFWVDDGDLRRNIIVKLNTRGERIKEINTSRFKSTNIYGVGAFHMLNDSLLLAYVQPSWIFTNENKFTASGYHVFNYKLGKTVGKHLFFGEYKEPDGVLYPGLYLAPTSGVIRSDKTRFAEAMHHFKQVNILDLESGKIKAITTKDSPSLDLSHLLPDKPPRYYYRFLRGDDRYIYVLEHVTGRSPGIVNVFDWDGNFVRILRINEGQIWFTFDPVRKIIYTKNSDTEKITAYDVNYLYE